MNVYLLRHAQAVPGYPDSERRLTPRGRSHAEVLGKWLRESPVALPGRIWCSPLVRARETLEIVGQAWGNGMVTEPSFMESLVPEGNSAAVVRALKAEEQDVLLVGHNPNMEFLASLLMSGERCRARLVIKTAVFLRFKWAPFLSHGETGPAELRWMLDPRAL